MLAAVSSWKRRWPSHAAGLGEVRRPEGTAVAAWWPRGGPAGLGQGCLTATGDTTLDCTLEDLGDESPSWAQHPDVEQASETPSRPALRAPWGA